MAGMPAIASVTIASIVATPSEFEAVIVARPGRTALTVPDVGPTVATVGSLEVQVAAVEVGPTLILTPLTSTNTGRKLSCWPIAMQTATGENSQGIASPG